MRVAIIDDYHNLAPSYTDSLTNLETETLLWYQPPSEAALITKLEPFDVICTMRERTPFPRERIERLPNLKILLTTGMRNLAIDYEACKDRGIVLAGTPAHAPPPNAPTLAATVQHTWALILSLITNIPRDHNRLISGSWLGATPLNASLPSLTLGIMGLGKLGKGVARIAKMGFGMKIIAWSEHLTQDRVEEAEREIGLSRGDISLVDKDMLLRTSDILSIHIVLSTATRGILGASDLAKMKPTSYLVNTSRGPLVDEAALLEVLEGGSIRGAALDVFDIEPLPLDSPWRTIAWGKDGRSEVVLTPHSGYAYEEGMKGMWESTTENLRRISQGEEVLWKLA